MHLCYNARYILADYANANYEGPLYSQQKLTSYGSITAHRSSSSACNMSECTSRIVSYAALHGACITCVYICGPNAWGKPFLLVEKIVRDTLLHIWRAYIQSASNPYLFDLHFSPQPFTLGGIRWASKKISFRYWDCLFKFLSYFRFFKNTVLNSYTHVYCLFYSIVYSLTV